VILSHILTSSLFYGVAAIAYLFVVMISTSPRVWGYTDYPEVVRAKIPPQTREEKRLALIVGLPWIAFALGFPIYSTLVLKSRLAGHLPFSIAFFSLCALFLTASLGDLVVLDWLIVSRITPRFVIIPGTTAQDYKDLSHHFKAHARSAAALVVVALVLAALLSSL
jgi:hypothetical protein